MDLAQQIRSQVEFYFSDSNIVIDKFLRAQIQLNKDGFVPIEVLAKFNRLKSLTTDCTVIAEALKSSDKLTLSEDGKMVKRTTPVPSSVDFLSRWIYTKGFPPETPWEEIKSIFTAFGTVLTVRIRRDKPTHKPKDSAFIEFATPEEAKAAAAAKPKFKETELLTMMKADYVELKKKEKAQSGKDSNKGDNNNNNNDSNNKKDNSNDTEESKNNNKKKKTREGKEEKEEEDDDEEGEDEARAKKRKTETEYIKGTILLVEGLPENVSREDLKSVFGTYGEIGYVEINNDTQSAYVRYHLADSAAAALAAWTSTTTPTTTATTTTTTDTSTTTKTEKAPDSSTTTSQKIVIAGKSPTQISLLEGEKEKEYWGKIRDTQANKAKGGRGRGRGGGRGRGRGRGGRKKRNF